jgi:cytochrome c peroxidase
MSRTRLILLFTVAAAHSYAGDAPAALSRPDAAHRAQALASLGRKMFFDPGLSASGKMSCSSCHDPRFAYGPPNARPVQMGGEDQSRWGIRAVPSLKYLQAIPQFTEHYFDSDDAGDDSIDSGPTGGLTWDGRVDRGRDQARIPLLSPVEMANMSPAAVVASIRRAKYAAEFRQLVSEGASGDTDAAFQTALEALEAWEQDYREFYPYSSKYDAWLAGGISLSRSEERGLKLFTDPGKGNCATCHIATRGANGTPPQFTDYGLIALGVPRNAHIPANRDSAWYDLGMCGPERIDLRGRAEYCGRFMTPSLRNVARRKVLFHNGAAHSLKDAVAFYVERDTRPEKWYPRGGNGVVVKFDDMPLEYRKNVYADAPFGQKPDGRPALTDREIADVVAFLRTLTDGFLNGRQTR